jgi:hypothetical protein
MPNTDDAPSRPWASSKITTERRWKNIQQLCLARITGFVTLDCTSRRVQCTPGGNAKDKELERLCSDVNKKPPKINEPEQLRPAIIKAEGSTEGERYLARIAERSFLNLWSYPAPYRDQKQHGVGDGKELCDLLVVCGDHIIIFSEKTICQWRRQIVPCGGVKVYQSG